MELQSNTPIRWRRLASITLLEALGITAFVLILLRTNEVYEAVSTAAFVVLFAVLTVEGVYGAHAYYGRPKPFSTMAVAAFEVVVWANWFIIIDYGLYSRHGIGPALFVLAAGLSIIHLLERLTLLGDQFSLGYVAGAIPAAFAEAVAGTVLWVFLTQQEKFPDALAPPHGEIIFPILGFLGLFGFLFIEHAARAEQLTPPRPD